MAGEGGCAVNIKEYVQGKYRLTTCVSLSTGEAIVLGVPLPLKYGWLQVHGKRTVTADQARSLVAFLLGELKRPSERRKLYAQSGIDTLQVAFGPIDVEPSTKETRKAERKAARLAQKQQKVEKPRPLPPPPERYAPPPLNVNTDEFLQSYEWRRVRMAVLKRDGARCACCGATRDTGATIHVDHIKPRRIFPELALHMDNLQVLCHECNHGKGNWDMTDWRKGNING
jgi:hypothetical protein